MLNFFSTKYVLTFFLKLCVEYLIINPTRPQKIPGFLKTDIAQTVSDGTIVKLEISHKKINSQT